MLAAAAPLDRALAAPNGAEMLLNNASKLDGLKRLQQIPYRSARKQIGALIKSVRTDREALRILIEALGLGGKRGARLLARVSQSRDTELALLAYRKVIALNEAKLLQGDMRRRLRGRSEPVILRQISSVELVKLGDKSIIGQLERIIADDGEAIDLRTQCVLDLAKLRGNKSVRFLNLTYQKSRLGFGPKNLKLRRSLIGALAQMESEDSIPTLIDALRVPELWHSSVDALVRLGDRAVPSLRLVLETSDDYLEPGVLAVLFRLKKIEASRFLHMIRSADQSVRDKARWVLTAFPDPAVVDTLVRHWGENELFPTKREILNLLAPHYAVPKVREIFRKAIALRSPELRRMALAIITSAGDRGREKEILGVAEDDPIEELKIQAIRSMVYLNLTMGKSLLERMLQFESRKVLNVASWALGWVGSPRTTPNRLRLTRKFRHPEIMPQLVRTAARLTGIPWMKNAEPGHYRNIPVFNAKRANKSAGVKTKTVEVNGKEITIGSFGSGDALLIFAPLPMSDSSAMLRGLEAVADDRKVIFFYDAKTASTPPYRVNAPMATWMRDAANLALKEHGAPSSVDVAGWSLGATWALRFCAEAPKRCKSLALISPLSTNSKFWNGVPGMLRASLREHLTSELALLEERRGQFESVAWATHYQRFLARLYMVNPVRAAMLSQSDFPLLFAPSEVSFINVQADLLSLIEEKISITAIFGTMDPMGGDWRDQIQLANAAAKDSSKRAITIQELEKTGHLVLYEEPKKSGKLVANFFD